MLDREFAPVSKSRGLLILADVAVEQSDFVERNGLVYFVAEFAPNDVRREIVVDGLLICLFRFLLTQCVGIKRQLLRRNAFAILLSRRSQLFQLYLVLPDCLCL